MSPKITRLLAGITQSGLKSYWERHFQNDVHYLSIKEAFKQSRDAFLSGNKTDTFTKKVYELASQGFGKVYSSILTEKNRHSTHSLFSEMNEPADLTAIFTFIVIILALFLINFCVLLVEILIRNLRNRKKCFTKYLQPKRCFTMELQSLMDMDTLTALSKDVQELCRKSFFFLSSLFSDFAHYSSRIKL